LKRFVWAPGRSAKSRLPPLFMRKQCASALFARLFRAVKPTPLCGAPKARGLDGEDVSRAIIDVAVKRGMTGQCTNTGRSLIHCKTFDGEPNLGLARLATPHTRLLQIIQGSSKFGDLAQAPNRPTALAC
jgi:hypothetical protein